jgi:hypothetical protein
MQMRTTNVYTILVWKPARKTICDTNEKVRITLKRTLKYSVIAEWTELAQDVSSEISYTM